MAGSEQLPPVDTEPMTPDRLSGVRGASITLRSLPDANGDQSSRDVRLTQVSGTTHDGIWQARVTLRPCDALGGSWDVAAFAWDAAAGTYVESPQAFTVLNGDVVPPTAAAVGDNQGGHAGDDPAAIAGTWACKDASGSVVDCSVGPVRQAAFTPTTPMIPGTNHTLVLNPEHHLGLTDLAVSPAA